MTAPSGDPTARIRLGFHGAPMPSALDSALRLHVEVARLREELALAHALIAGVVIATGGELRLTEATIEGLPHGAELVVWQDAETRDRIIRVR